MMTENVSWFILIAAEEDGCSILKSVGWVHNDDGSHIALMILSLNYLVWPNKFKTKHC